MSGRRVAHGAIGCVIVMMIGSATCDARQSAGSLARPLLHWGASGTNAHQIDLTGLPILHDTVFYYEHQFGRYPRFWNGVAENGGSPHYNDLAAHLAKVQSDVPKKIPDPAWSGFACIDFESWHPVWDLSPRAFRDAAVQQVKNEQPNLSAELALSLAKSRHEIAAKEFLLRTIEACKALRPKARWGFFNMPASTHQGYVSQTAWLWEGSTAFFPAVSVDNMTVNHTSPGPGQTTIWMYRLHVDLGVGLAKSVGPGKPVIGVGWLRYPDFNPVYAFQFLTPTDVREMLQRPRAAGADGIILWDFINTASLVAPYSSFVQSTVRPAVDLLVSQDPLWRFIPGDANDDQSVDYHDLMSVLSAWATDYRPTTGTGYGDASRNGIVDFGDVFSVTMNLGAGNSRTVP